MRWSYKTVHYELKKEGLLGSAFLDEPEIELSLNEYGRAGWELISLLETMDGVIAVFKQPLSSDSSTIFNINPERSKRMEIVQQEDDSVSLEIFAQDEGGMAEERVAPVLDEFEVVEEDSYEEKPDQKNVSESGRDVGSIRIE